MAAVGGEAAVTDLGSDPPAATAASGKPEASGYVNPFLVGPEVRIPAVSLLAAAWGVTALVGGAAWLIASRSKPGSEGAAWLGAAAVAGAFLAAAAGMQPWKPRRLGKIAVVWMAGRMVCLFSVLVFGSLLYFAPPQRPDPLVMGLTLGTAYFAAVIAESVVMARALRRAPGEQC